jgi:hypothetical protein
MRHTFLHSRAYPHPLKYPERSLLQAKHPGRSLLCIPQPKIQLQRPPPFPALTPRWRGPLILFSQSLHINSSSTAYSPRMFARLVLTCQEPRLLAQPEEALRKTYLLCDVGLASFKQNPVGICELRCPAVLLPLDAYLEARGVKGVHGFVGCHGLGGWGRRERMRRVAL